MAHSSRGSSRGSRGGSGGGLKSSPIVAVVAVLLIVFAIYKIFLTINPSTDEYDMKNFPYYFAAVSSTEEYDKFAKEGFAKELIRFNQFDKPQNPFQREGAWHWDLYVCGNANCPWLEKNPGAEPFVFPNVPRPFFNDYIQWANDGYPSYDFGDPENPPTKEQTDAYAKLQEMQSAEVVCPQCATKRGAEARADFRFEPYRDEEGKKLYADMLARLTPKK